MTPLTLKNDNVGGVGRERGSLAMDKVHCIVAGGGPAGAACAYGLSKKGIETVLIERGRSPGEKNVAPVVLFTDVLESLSVR
jgi:flavin-dependent dehydrogenase